jgi:hypothetical protein
MRYTVSEITTLRVPLVEALLQAGNLQVRFPMRSFDFSIDVILPAALGPGVY